MGQSACLGSPRARPQAPSSPPGRTKVAHRHAVRTRSSPVVTLVPRRQLTGRTAGRAYSGQRDGNMAGGTVRAAARRHRGARVEERGDQAHGRGDAGRGAEHDQERAGGRRRRHHGRDAGSRRLRVSRAGGEITIAPNGKLESRVPAAFTGLNRIPILMLGPLLHRTGEAFVPLVGGDPIGRRPVDFHVAALRALGAEIEAGPDGITARAASRLHGARGSTCRTRAWAPPRRCCCPRCGPRARRCCATRPPNPRWSSSPCSCSGWARRSSSARTGGSSSRACPGCAARPGGWPATGSRRSPTWRPG